MMDRMTILLKAHWGLKVFCLFLHRLFPGIVVMHLKGRDAGLCPNPWDAGRPTLHIWHEKLYPQQKLSAEIARFHDLSGQVPDGDCFDFAERMTGLSGQELLEWIDEEMHLHIRKPNQWYSRPAEAAETTETAVSEEATEIPLFSFFKAPIRNTVPYRDITPYQAWVYLTGKYAVRETAQLRSLTDRKAARQFKAGHFAYACFSGTFTKRSDDALVKASGLMCIDFDHVGDVDALKAKLLADPSLETVLAFRSPSGDGLKWVISVDLSEMSHQRMFAAVCNYLKSRYGVEADPSGRDVSRACFLPHDPDAYLNPDYNEAL